MGQTQAAHGKSRKTEDDVDNDNDKRELEALRLAARAARAIEALNSHQKSLVQEIGERRKRLKNLIASIQQQEAMGELQLRGIDSVSMSFEVESLVHDPVRGL